MTQSINFPICRFSIAPYGNWNALGGKLGLEIRMQRSEIFDAMHRL